MKRLIIIYLPLVLLYLFSIQSSSSQTLKKEAFKIADKNTYISLPLDHGSHEEFQTEWWYFTGQLFKEGKAIFKDAADYGVQLTFFRRGIQPPPSSWSQLFLLHKALTDLNNKNFSYNIAYERGGIGRAGAAQNTLDVFNGQDSAVIRDNNLTLNFEVVDQGKPCKVSLNAPASQTIVLQGENGYSKKGNCESCASIYYSLPRIDAKGEINCEDQSSKVTGILWMDHEYMTNSLQKDQTGWDWFGLNTSDSKSIMIFKIRSKNPAEDYIFGSVYFNGQTISLVKEDIIIIPKKFWKSKSTKANYPLEWNIRIDKINFDQTIKALYEEQELADKEKSKGLTYWEGAVSSQDQSTIGYMELTGYDSEIGGKF